MPSPPGDTAKSAQKTGQGNRRPSVLGALSSRIHPSVPENPWRKRFRPLAFPTSTSNSLAQHRQPRLKVCRTRRPAQKGLVGVVQPIHAVVAVVLEILRRADEARDHVFVADAALEG